MQNVKWSNCYCSSFNTTNVVIFLKRTGWICEWTLKHFQLYFYVLWIVTVCFQYLISTDQLRSTPLSCLIALHVQFSLHSRQLLTGLLQLLHLGFLLTDYNSSLNTQINFLQIYLFFNNFLLVYWLHIFLIQILTRI